MMLSQFSFLHNQRRLCHQMFRVQFQVFYLRPNLVCKGLIIFFISLTNYAVDTEKNHLINDSSFEYP